MHALPPITNKQQTILKFLYCFRFLSRTQIQQFLQHKDNHTIHYWLKDLTTKDYLGFKPAIYHQSAIYYLERNAIRYLRTLNDTDKQYLHNLYHESKRSTALIDRCQLLGDICLELTKESSDDWSIFTRSSFYELPTKEVLISQSVSAYLIHQGAEKTNYYLLSILGDEPTYRLRKKIKGYFELYSSSEWEEDMDQPFPILRLICLNEKTVSYLKKLIRKLSEQYESILNVEIFSRTIFERDLKKYISP